MEKNSYQGKFIVFEGLDGSGQSTQASLLRGFLIEKNYQVVLTKEPTIQSEAGRRIKEVLEKRSEITPSGLQELFAKDRGEHLRNIVIPSLKEGRAVISDRYFFSSFAYGASEGLDLEWLIRINNDFLLPDLTIILEVRPEVCISRIEGRGSEKTLFEKKEKLAKVWEVYEKLPVRFENVKVIDGEKPIEEVFSQVKEAVLSKIKEK